MPAGTPGGGIGGGVGSANLACSGARTSTFTDSSGNFKPAIDFSNDGAGPLGQRGVEVGADQIREAAELAAPLPE